MPVDIVAPDGRLRFHFSDAPISQKTKNVESSEPERILTDQEIRDLESRNIQAALTACGGTVYGPNGAANLLGLKPTTLNSRIKSLGIREA